MSNQIKIQSDEEIIARHDPKVRKRARTELAVIHRVIKDLKAAGKKLAVDDGDDEIIADDEQLLVTAIMGVDDANLITDGGMSFVRFVMGNDGHDVINDYGVSLEPIIGPINEWTDAELAAGRF